MWNVLDTSVLLQGGQPPPGRVATTPEVMAEVSPGGRDARRLSYWEAAGLQVRAATPESLQRVRETARGAGNLGRLSIADVSVLALALDLRATAWTDDNTMLDVAARLDVPTQAVRDGGIKRTLDWAPRCTGCGRWGGAGDGGDGAPGVPCRVCGSPVALRPRR